MNSLVTHFMFATYFSRNLTFALRNAVDLMQATGANLLVLHFVEPMSDDARITLRMFIQDESARANAMNDREKFVKAQLTERQKYFWAALPAN